MRRFILVTLVLFSLCGGYALAQQFSTLEERMTYAEFKAAGLEKLTPEELAALNSWLAGKSSGAVAATPAVDNRGFEGRTGAGGAVVSTVAGPFKGWKGKGDRITLANGQVWEQVEPASLAGVRRTDPAVKITPSRFGNTWFMKIDGYNTAAPVRRIK